jgi:hypothetical protein
MKLLYLSRVGQRYDGEEGKAGDRIIALTALENFLKAFITDRNNAQAKLDALNGPAAPLAVPGETSFQRARRMQQEAIENHQIAGLSPKDRFAQQSKLDTNIAELDHKIQRVTTWLEREDATALPDGSINWAASARNVEYDHVLAQQDMTRLRFSAGKMYTDDAWAIPFDTADLVTHASGPGKAIYVMSKLGNLHVSRHSVGYRHHSSLLAGQKTAAAGELEVTAGKLLWISNKSGHYRPNLKHFLQVLHILEKNLITNSFRITFNTVIPAPAGIGFSTHMTQYSDTAAFLASLQADGEEYWDYELNKLLLYGSHLEDKVLRKHTPNFWRWRDADAGELPGVYDGVTSLFVPHKEVRQWLKSRGRLMSKDVQTGAGR